MLDVGDSAPDFELPDQDGRPVRLGDHRDERVVVWFYPEAGTSRCTIQACSLRDRRRNYARAGVTVLGISPDPPAKLREFADGHALGLTLLSDSDRRVAEQWGVLPTEGTDLVRSTFVVDPGGTISHAFRRVDAERHDEIVLAALAGA